MPKVILVKQGKTDYDTENRIQGVKDISLSEAGKKDVTELAAKLKDVDFKRVYSSPILSSTETANIIAKGRSATVAIDERLKCVNQGRWQGLTLDEIKKGYRIFYSKWERDPTSVTPPAGESIVHVLQKVAQFWFEKVSRENEAAVIVTSSIIGAILRLYIQAGFDESEAKKRMRKLWKMFPIIPDDEEFDIK